jgi:LSD1 subclass zinc finger protein
MSGSFTQLPGSTAMGHAEYSLWLTNSSSQTCTVAGRPSLQLLDRGGKPLPTDATPWQPARTASAVTLSPGGSAEATTLVAVDIPGPGDSHRPGGPCQPTAAKLRVGAAGKTSTLVPIQPPTPVCERGAILLKPLAALTPVMPSGLLATLKTLLRYPHGSTRSRCATTPTIAAGSSGRGGPPAQPTQSKAGPVSPTSLAANGATSGGRETPASALAPGSRER